jgi:hypothetical protein
VKKGIGMVVLGIGGLAAAVALTLGALALAGDDVGDVVQPALTPSRSTTDAPSSSEADRSETPSPSVDDHGGSSSGSDDPPGDDNSGSGSSNSGSGSENSGSGSDGSGSDDD